MAMTTGWLLSVATDFGLQLHVARVVASAERRRATAARWWRLKLAFAAFGCVPLAVAAASAPAGMRLGTWLIGAAYLVTGLAEFTWYVCRGLGRSEIESSLLAVQRATLVGAALPGLWWHPTLDVLGLAFIGSAVLGLLASLSASHHLLTTSDRASAWPVKDATEESLFRAWGRDVAPLGLGIVLSALYFRIDLFLIDRWLGAIEAGHYNAVFRLVEALRLLPAAVVAVMLPDLLQARTRGPLQQLLARLAATGAVIAALGWLTAPVLVDLIYGASFAGSTSPLRVLLLAFPCLAVNYALTHQLIAWHGQRHYATVTAIALASNLMLNRVLIPLRGLEGAAWATLGTEVVVTALCGAALWRAAPRRSPTGFAMRVAAR